MSISTTAARAALVFVITIVSGAAFAQGTVPAKRPTVGGKPIVQVKPTAPMGCKLVGTVKGTKLWAGECMAPPEPRTTTSPEDKAPTLQPDIRLFPMVRNRSTRNKAVMRNADGSQSGMNCEPFHKPDARSGIEIDVSPSDKDQFCWGRQ
jgi:hypothetical protein